MNTQIKVQFYLRKSKINANGLIPVYQKILINRKPFDISTGFYVLESSWSKETNRIKRNNEEARTINKHLDKLIEKVSLTERALFLKGIDLTFESFKIEFTGKTERTRQLIPIFQDHNKKLKELVGIEYAAGTLERYETSLKHTQDFLKWKFNKPNIGIEQIDHAFITDYEFYLRSERKCANNTAVKYIKNFHKIINICLANGWLTKDPFRNYKSKVKEVEREFLSEHELQDIIDKGFVSERLTLVRDIFIFSCFTGLAYIDVKQLSNNNLTIGIDGDKWLFKNRQKTDTTSKIPLLPTAQAILEKYKDHPVCKNENKLLPILSNQKMNAYLKEIADVCGINKDLTFHIARHTFATTVTLSNGVPLETVSKMLGHTNLKTTQHYAKILDKKISQDMQFLKEKFKLQSTETVSISVSTN
ncbi:MULTISPECIES: site-specific integrase [Flavobacterium]|uniref:site-specific integrase n=1 Tax=Flavobacterium TaxID=237 RepID=UPI001FCA60DE|nr:MULTISPECIES: site-specific integrase [Flavobacterium]UOK43392.1 site-specific integrase [Flavobacterium enshiense]